MWAQRLLRRESLIALILKTLVSVNFLCGVRKGYRHLPDTLSSSMSCVTSSEAPLPQANVNEAAKRRGRANTNSDATKCEGIKARPYILCRISLHVLVVVLDRPV